MRGLLIAFEGIDKAGKGTQSTLLAEERKCKRIAFPRYETELGGAIRKHLHGLRFFAEEHVIDSPDPAIDGDSYWVRAPEDALVFQCMMLADKMDAAGEILVELDAGRDVVLDRWTDSALAYGGADGLSVEWINRTQAPLPRADVTFFLDVLPDVALARGRGAGDHRTAHDRYEKVAPLNAVRQRYLDIFGVSVDGHTSTIDGTRPTAEIAEIVRAHLRGFRPRKNRR